MSSLGGEVGWHRTLGSALPSSGVRRRVVQKIYQKKIGIHFPQTMDNYKYARWCEAGEPSMCQDHLLKAAAPRRARRDTLGVKKTTIRVMF